MAAGHEQQPETGYFDYAGDSEVTQPLPRVTGPSGAAGGERDRAGAAAACMLLAGGLGVAAMFLPYARQSLNGLGSEQGGMVRKLTPWQVVRDFEMQEPSIERMPLLYGVALCLLIAGMLLVAVTVTRPAASPARSAARPAALIILGGTTCFALLLTLDVLSWLSVNNPRINDFIQYDTAIGFWLMLAMAAFAIAGAVLALLAGNSARPARGRS